ncbi:hypothetical protein Ciccas_006360, partial [Cichlidogyrus casuarinus]
MLSGPKEEINPIDHSLGNSRSCEHLNEEAVRHSIESRLEVNVDCQDKFDSNLKLTGHK